MLILILLCLASLAAGKSVTNFTNIATRLSSSLSTITAATNTSQISCSIYVDFVELNIWYNSSLEYTKETIITEFAQYNNTIVPSTTVTVINNATNPYSDLYGTRENIAGEGFSFINIPNIIGGDGDWYDATAVDSSTIWKDNYISIASPSPFAIVSTAFFRAGSAIGVDEPVDAGADFGGGEFDDLDTTLINLNPPWYWLPGLDFISNWTYGGPARHFDLSPELISFIDSQPSVKSKYPFLTQCGVGYGSGAPTLHIPVAELTVERATTIPVGGNYGGGDGGGGAGGNTEGVPGGDVTTAAGNPSTTSQPAQPRTRTQVVAPPTGTAQFNPDSTLPMGSDSIYPASSSPGDPQDSASQAKPQSAGSSSSVVAAGAGKTQSQGSSHVPNDGSGSGLGSGSGPDSGGGSGSGFGGKASQAAGAKAQGSQQAAVPSVPAASSNTILAVDSESSIGGNPNVGRISQVASGAGVDIVSALRPSGGGNTYNAGGYSTIVPAGGGNGGSEYSSVPGQEEPGQVPATTPASVIIGDAIATPVAPSAYALPDGYTITAGGAPVVAAGTTYSLGASGAVVVVNGQTISSIAAYQPGSGTVNLGNAIAIPLRPNAFAIGGQTLSVNGAPVVVSGTTYSLGPSSAVVVNGQTVSTLSAYSNPTTIALGNAIATPLGSNAYAIGSQTLRAGGPPITVSGDTYSLSPSGAAIINGQTISSLPPGPEYSYPTSSDVTALTLGTAVLAATPTAGSALVIDGQTLLPGHAITVTQDGQVETISVPADGLADGGYVGVVNGVTQSLAAGETLLTEPNGVVLTLSPTGVGEYVVGGATLVPGGEAVVTDGVTVSEAPGGDVVEVSGGVTSTIGSVGGDTGAGGGVGYYINSGVGGGTTSAPVAHLGKGARLVGGAGLRFAAVAVVLLYYLT
ncbi:hypothetical protein EV356DRAFT_514638 [Viridothelium virens]|uniref:Uncharacterized protein n=1 Tax=Viridothelium virens TaxID=1048519 RepID=A0A6A6HAE2_VIRVR|nr:hypothetical protein EV356DRAFT_514638 [Viridothelium virens]